MAYTSGPWYGFEDSGVYKDMDQFSPVFQTGCGCCTKETLSRDDANLISQAPDMHNLLMKIKGMILHNQITSRDGKDITKDLLNEIYDIDNKVNGD